MKIVVTADTHLKEAGKLPARLTSELQSADFIIHAGDWKTADVYTAERQCSSNRSETASP
ncbi:metallophosphoesterase family protein [Lentibacillus salinarum]|uniref:Metallophosphoesterase family protein n=1 Tax=Lentibacillus salinarum TaxID=446820 RepID=A0ABW3ZTW3_9BACI